MKFSTCLAAVLIVLTSVPPVSAQVRVSAGTLSLPTYEEGPPDRNPPFDQIATSRFNYPYTLRTNVTDQRTVHNWRAVFLENEYLKCTVLPDLGGHLYTCIDKINGKPMFYANPSIKKANIGYRGAWAAFGVEYNFPVSHNWMSLSPIDFSYSQNADGSASVTVGNIDRVYGMQWSVEMLLRPKSTVLEQRVSLSNRSDVRHRFYWWNNAGVEVWDDSHVEYPMRFAASHGFTEVQTWPVDSSGRDLSTIHNQTEGPVSWFVHGSREPFMGVWNPHTNSGTAHFANYDELPAKKIWSWGVDADGLDWRKALSDNNSAYVELQGGLFRNQETYAFLEPRQTIHFSEFWMPVREIGAITRANLAGVLSLNRDGSKILLGFNSNQPVSGAKVSVSDGAKEIWSEGADLVPEHTWSHALPIADTTRKYTVEIKDDSGNALMRQTEDQFDWTPVSEIKVGQQQSYKFPTPENRTEDDWLRLGEDQELNGRLLIALETYANLLQKFPTSYQGLKAAGRLSASLLHYDAAVGFLEQVRARDTTDAEAAYYLGIAYDGIGSEQKARDSFEAAYHLPRWRPAAAVRLGELSARMGDLAKAEHYLAAASRLAPDDARAAEEFAAIERAHGDKGLARSLVQESLRRFPLSYSLRDVLETADAQHLANDHSRLLNLAAEYMRLGLYSSALDVLSRKFPEPLADQSEPGTYAPSRDPMLAYYRAYCRSKLGQSPESDYQEASTLPTNYVFPSSADDLIVLRAATEANLKDANAHYLLGTLYFSRALTDQALDEWRQAKTANAKIPVLDASMGIALLQVKHDPASALAAFRDGVSADPQNDAVYLGADQSLSLLKKPSGERVQVFDAYPDPPKMPAPLVYELALNLAESGDFDRAIALFHNRFFPREEGGTNVRQVWIEVQLQHALNLAKNGNCAAASSIANDLGKPVSDVGFTNDGLQRFVGAPRTQYFIGKMYAKCSNADLARKQFESVAGKSAGGEIVWAWLAAKELPNFNRAEWSRRLQSALGPTQIMSETSSYGGWWIYNAGMLQRALGREDDAQREFRSALLLPDRMLSYHLTREALNSK